VDPWKNVRVENLMSKREELIGGRCSARGGGSMKEDDTRDPGKPKSRGIFY